METIIAIGIWVMIFLVWCYRTYPERFQKVVSSITPGIKRKQSREKTARGESRPRARNDFRSLVEVVERTCARERFGSSDAAAMVQAVKKIMELEPASGQIWEAYVLDSLETAEIICDDCRIPVLKKVKKTGVRIACKKCGKWLALRNSKVMIIDPSRVDLEDWEK